VGGGGGGAGVGRNVPSRCCSGSSGGNSAIGGSVGQVKQTAGRVRYA